MSQPSLFDKLNRPGPVLMVALVLCLLAVLVSCLLRIETTGQRAAAHNQVDACPRRIGADPPVQFL